MSAAARKRIRAAQRGRWAKWKSARRSQYADPGRVFHTSVHRYFVFMPPFALTRMKQIVSFIDVDG
jgi:hypothetical protein